MSNDMPFMCGCADIVEKLLEVQAVLLQIEEGEISDIDVIRNTCGNMSKTLGEIIDEED